MCWCFLLSRLEIGAAGGEGDLLPVSGDAGDGEYAIFVV